MKTSEKKRPKRTKAEKAACQAKLHEYMQQSLKAGKELSLNKIFNDFKSLLEKSNLSAQHQLPIPKKSTVVRDLEELQYYYIKEDKIYRRDESEEERKKRLSDYNQGVLAQNIISHKHNIYWLPIKTRPGQGKSVAAAMMQNYPQFIFGCIPGTNYVCAAFTSKEKRQRVQEHLQLLSQLTAEDIEMKNFPPVKWVMGIPAEQVLPVRSVTSGDLIPPVD